MKKEIYLPYFKDKKVTVMGLGLLGRGIGDTHFLATSGADIVVTDKKTDEELISSKDALSTFPNIAYHLGGHVLSDFENRDFILKAAGVPYDSEYILHAEKQSVPVYMSAALVCKIIMEHLPNVTIIGITGTRGKSTVTELITHILRTNNLQVRVGGNIRGVANLPILDDIEDGEYLVLELDSWQLQGFRDLGISPHIAVFTSFMDDHMNYYKDDREKYFNDKASIYLNQTENDVLIASSSVASIIENSKDQKSKKRDVLVPDEMEFVTTLIGKHNQELLSLAYEAATQCGLFDDEIRDAITSFKAVEGRLQDMGLVKGIHTFNDNNATTGDATIAAISAIVETHHKKPILIVGGTDKGLDISALEKAIQENTKDVIYLAGTGTSRITLSKEYIYERLEDCVMKAFAIAQDGDIILFSPGFASFSQYFRNEYERNDVFLESVEKYSSELH